MAKWFDTNYHYLVPEIGPGTRLRLAGGKPLAKYAEARSIGIETRPVLLGPLSFLLLAKPLDEPVLAADRTGSELAALQRACRRLGLPADRPQLLVATYFGEIGAALPVLAASLVDAIGLDFVAGPGNLQALARAGGIGEKTHPARGLGRAAGRL